MYTIYKIIFPNGKCYIGLTKNLEKRKISHKTTANTGKEKQRPVYNAIRKYGFDNLIWETLSTHDSIEDACDSETKMIIEHTPNYNIAAGGMVHKYSPEMRERMSKAQAGKKQSEEAKHKRSESLKKFYDKKGRKEQDIKVKKRHRRPSSPETVQKQREHWERRKQKNIEKLAAIYIDGMSLKELSELSGIKIHTICSYNRAWEIKEGIVWQLHSSDF